LKSASSDNTNTLTARRRILSVLAWSPLLLTPSLCHASQDNDDDLTTKLFNPDGSLKSDAGISETSAFVPVTRSTDDGIQLFYKIPSKISLEGYIDSSNGLKSLDSVSVKATGGTKRDLEKAATVGIGKALRLDASNLDKADLVSGRKRLVQDEGEGVLYYDFDLAVAPETCAGGTKEDLGLGFCPYENIGVSHIYIYFSFASPNN